MGERAREPIEPSLEAAMRRGEDVADVYADWLMERGHPRGRLIAVQRALRERLDDRELRTEERHLIDALLGPLAGLDVTWRDGFVHAARVDDADELERLLRDPSARLLSELAVSSHAGAAAMRAWPPPPLRRLAIGRQASDAAVSVAELGARFPMLEELALHGEDVEVGELDLPRLRSLQIGALDLSARTIDRVLGAAWPALVTIDLWLGGSELSHGNAAALLADGAFPALRVLRVGQVPVCRPLAVRLLVSPRARVLEELALSDLDDATADLLVEHRAAFAQLVRADLRGDLSQATIDRLNEAFPR